MQQGLLNSLILVLTSNKVVTVTCKTHYGIHSASGYVFSILHDFFFYMKNCTSVSGQLQNIVINVTCASVAFHTRTKRRQTSSILSGSFRLSSACCREYFNKHLTSFLKVKISSPTAGNIFHLLFTFEEISRLV
jgi:hypothetical protein